MKILVKSITIVLVTIAVISPTQAANKKAISKGGASFSLAQKSGGGHTAYPGGEFPTPGTAAEACGGMGNVGSVQDTSDDGVQHAIRYFCAEL